MQLFSLRTPLRKFSFGGISFKSSFSIIFLFEIKIKKKNSFINYLFYYLNNFALLFSIYYITSLIYVYYYVYIYIYLKMIQIKLSQFYILYYYNYIRRNYAFFLNIMIIKCNFL
jgi:hypothetical protein